jgi:hypothetical protein
MARMRTGGTLPTVTEYRSRRTPSHVTMSVEKYQALVSAMEEVAVDVLNDFIVPDTDNQVSGPEPEPEPEPSAVDWRKEREQIRKDRRIAAEIRRKDKLRRLRYL